MPLLQVILVSTRPGRVGAPVAHWFRDHAVRQNNFDVELLDLAHVNLPLFDEPTHPRLRQYAHDHTKAWSARRTGAKVSKGRSYELLALGMAEYRNGNFAAADQALLAAAKTNAPAWL